MRLVKAQVRLDYKKITLYQIITTTCLMKNYTFFKQMIRLCFLKRYPLFKNWIQLANYIITLSKWHNTAC